MMAMNCNDFRAAITDAIERRSPPTAETAAHLDTCRDPACRACWDDARLLERAIARWRTWVAAEQTEIADRIVSACQTDVPEAAQGRELTVVMASTRRGSPVSSLQPAVNRRGLAALSVAALVLVALVALRPSDSELPQRTVARNEPGRAPAVSRDRNAPIPSNDSRSVATTGDPGLAYVSYAQNAVQFVTDAVVMTVGDSSEMEDPKLSPPQLGWDSAWPPIEEGMQNALHGLLESLPAEAPHS